MSSLMRGAIVDICLDIDLVVFLYDITLWMFNAMSSFHIPRILLLICTFWTKFKMDKKIISQRGKRIELYTL
jgi:hypothetical protein